MSVPQLPKHRLVTPVRHSKRRILLVAGLLVLALLAAPGAVKYFYSEQLGSQVNRVPDVFTSLDATARPPATPTVLTFLLVGTDTRSDIATTGTDASGDGTGGGRSDVLMLARVDPSRPSATVVSIPRDSWVDIPGHGKNKINAAYAFGGPSLLIQTVEKLTDIRIDHLVVIDFAGFQALVDAVGGIDVNVLVPTGLDDVQFQAGPNHLDGYAALKFVRQRHGLPDGDLDRAQREQSALRAILVKITSNGTLSDLDGVYRFLDAAKHSIGVDDTLTNGALRALGSRLRNLQASDIQFLLAPVDGFGREGQQAVNYLDTRAADLWTALRTGTADAYVARHQADILGTSTR